jgi:hypothetical protein
MHQALRQHYRLPDDGVEFKLQGDLSSACGFFRFGSHVVCYGKNVRGSLAGEARGASYDAAEDVVAQGSTITLPFEPGEIVENLRCERYVNHRPSAYLAGPARQLVRNSYYFVRPMLPVPVRRHLQKLYLSGREKLPFPQWPVDCTVERCHEKLLEIRLQAGGEDRLPFVWFWPRGASGCLIMTHDIETAAGRDFCGTLMDLNDSFAMKASFQVVPEKRYAVSENYIEGIWKRGFEVGVQDLNHDGHLYSDREEFLRRAAKINAYGKKYRARGFRAAILYRNQEWFSDLDFEFDMSVPNVAHLDPQGGGCCTVMPFFVGKILELPVTTTQDYSLFHILGDYSLTLWKKQIELILERHGLISFIIHPDYIIGQKERDVYTALLSYLRDLCRERNVWLALPHEVNQWWRQRSQMRVVRGNDGHWKIEGAGCEHAQIAYAQLAGGRLTYEHAST